MARRHRLLLLQSQQQEGGVAVVQPLLLLQSQQEEGGVAAVQPLLPLPLQRRQRQRLRSLQRVPRRLVVLCLTTRSLGRSHASRRLRQCLLLAPPSPHSRLLLLLLLLLTSARLYRCQAALRRSGQYLP